jgi:hypothetical protein
MVIKFQCPSGHPLSAPENMAGKQGKCPKCGQPFVIPAADPQAAADQMPPAAANPGAAAGAPPGGSGMNLATDGNMPRELPAMGSGKGTASPEEIFVFLCPNGHKLNGPPSLKGKAGQCPHCGAKFRIPTDDELEAPEEEEEDVPVGEVEDEDEEIAAGQLEEEDSPQGFRFNFGQADNGQDSAESGGEEGQFIPPPGAPGLGYICGRLWDFRDDITEIEIFLNEGEIMSPDYYCELLSSSDYGVFASRETDGNYAITVIPWSAVRRVGMRKISELPEGLFREHG